MKILIDMNLPPRWVQVFTNAGFEAIHWSQVGSPTASDREIMTWARDSGYNDLPMTLISRPFWRLRKQKARVSSRSVRKIFSRKRLGTWLSTL
jgi:hypothetical protein